MLPFCGYNMGDYFGHWLEIGESADADKLPRLFWVNWFRKGDDGTFMWPGFGDNSRVLKWIIEEVDGNGEGVDTPIGRVPAPTAIDTSGLDIDAETITKLVSVDAESWRQEVPQIEAHYASIGQRAQLVDVPITVDVTRQVPAAKLEEHPLDEEIDQMVEQQPLQRVVTLYELDRAQDVVLLRAHPLDQSILCIHADRIHHVSLRSLPRSRICNASARDRAVRPTGPHYLPGLDPDL